MSNFQITVQFLNFAGVVIAILLGLKRLTGGPEKHEITNRPLLVEKADKFVTADDCVKSHKTFVEKLESLTKESKETTAKVAAHEVMIAKLATKNELTLMKQDIDGKIDDKFSALDLKRRTDVGNLHQHIEKTNHDTHSRIDALSERVVGAIGELKGEMKRI